MVSDLLEITKSIFNNLICNVHFCNNFNCVFHEKGS